MVPPPKKKTARMSTAGVTPAMRKRERELAEKRLAAEAKKKLLKKTARPVVKKSKEELELEKLKKEMMEKKKREEAEREKTRKELKVILEGLTTIRKTVFAISDIIYNRIGGVREHCQCNRPQ